MYEALVARVRYHIEKANFMGLKEAESTLLLKEAADAIEELSGMCRVYAEAQTKEHNRAVALENRMRWIPVTEQLPKEMETVIVTDGKNVGYSFCVNDYGTLDFYSPWNITHWMPLPEPPKEE